MVLVGVSIEDDQTDGVYSVFAINLKGDVEGGTLGKDGSSDVTKINTIPAGKAGEGDLEGLATQGSSNVFAITESDTINALYSNVQGSESKAKLSGVRFGDDAGLDFASNGKLYNIQGEDEGTIGSKLYLIAGGKATLVSSSKEFADGLAISGKLAIASDFENSDGDGDELYTVKLTKTGPLLTPLAQVKFVDFKGKSISQLNSDSGLDFTPDGSKLYAIEDETNDLFVATRTDLLDGNKVVTFKEVNDDLPEQNKKIKDVSEGEFEGLAIAELDVSFGKSSSALFNTEAGQDVLTAAAATMFDSTAISSI